MSRHAQNERPTKENDDDDDGHPNKKARAEGAGAENQPGVSAQEGGAFAQLSLRSERAGSGSFAVLGRTNTGRRRGGGLAATSWAPDPSRQETPRSRLDDAEGQRCAGGARSSAPRRGRRRQRRRRLAAFAGPGAAAADETPLASMDGSGWLDPDGPTTQARKVEAQQGRLSGPGRTMGRRYDKQEDSAMLEAASAGDRGAHPPADPTTDDQLYLDARGRSIDLRDHGIPDRRPDLLRAALRRLLHAHKNRRVRSIAIAAARRRPAARRRRRRATTTPGTATSSSPSRWAAARARPSARARPASARAVNPPGRRQRRPPPDDDDGGVPNDEDEGS